MATVYSIKSPKNTYLYLHFTFEHNGKKYFAREATGLIKTPENFATVKAHAARIEAEQKLGIFDYLTHFPGGNLREQLLDATKMVSDKTFKEYAEDWIEKNPADLRPSTLADYEYSLKKVYGHIGPMRLSNISLEALKEIEKEHRGNSNSRVNNIFKPIRKIMAHALAKGIIGNNPCLELKSLDEDEDRGDIDPFSVPEINKLLKALPSDYWRNYFLLAFLEGPRIPEQVALWWEHIKFDIDKILIRHVYVKGEYGHVKTKYARRDLDMLPPVKEALLRQRTLTGGDKLVFPNTSGLPWNPYNILRQVWEPALTKAELRYRPPMQTRHSFASNALLEGEDIQWVRMMLGHKDLTMIFKHYSGYIKNRTRRDGSALTSKFEIGTLK